MGKHDKKIQAVRDLLVLEETDAKSKSLKSDRLYREELRKRSQEYRLNAEKKLEVDQLSNTRKLKEEIAKAKPESGTEAIDRILGEIKGASSNVANKSGEPLYPNDFPKPMPDQQRYHTGLAQRLGKSSSIDESKKPIPFESATGLYEKELKEGIHGTKSYIGGQRVKELEDQLRVAKSAKESKTSFPEAEQNKALQDKFREYIQFFNKPGVPPEKVRYLAELQAKQWFEQTYGK